MPGALLHVGAVVMCPHAGQAADIPSQQRVLVSGMPVATAADNYVIVGCPVFLGPVYHPCVTIRWITPSTRVFLGGAPALTQSSMVRCLAVDQLQVA